MSPWAQSLRHTFVIVVGELGYPELTNGATMELNEGRPMGSRKFHEIWIEQCDAARDIKTRFGLKAAFDYVVTEKLLDFVSAAADHPEFARELPRFFSEVRRVFTREELRTHLARVEREQREKMPMPLKTMMMDLCVKVRPASPSERGSSQRSRSC
jgi:hypothetical protein